MNLAVSALPFALLSSVALAAPVSLSGSVTGDLPSAPRVTAWTVNVSGAPIAELAGTGVEGGKFTLALPETAPPARATFALLADNLTWPGVTGGASVTPGVRAAEVRLFVYGDANGNGRRDDGEALLEANTQAGRASVLLVYVDRDTSVRGERGLNVALVSGWNAVSIELGKTLKSGVTRDLAGVKLVVTR